MLPGTGEILKQDFIIIEQPSRTYQLGKERLSGYTDGLEAVKQAVYCILNTERFDWVIYSWNYGVELKDLFGKPMNLVKSKIKKRIREALTQDDRILSVEDFLFETSGRKLAVSFTVRSKFGEFQTGKEVTV